MLAVLLQDWITIRGDGSAGVTSVTQATDDWADLAEFHDVVFWMEVKEVTLGGATSVQMNYDTAPSKDAGTFVQCTKDGVALVMTASNVTVSPVLATGVSLQPLARWLRWRIAATGATAAWDATFRVWMAVNYLGRSSAVADQAAADAYVPYGCDGDS